MVDRKDLKPACVVRYLEVLEGVPGVVGVWRMNGAPCVYGHASCVGYLGVFTPERFHELVRRFGEVYSSSAEIRNSSMCWSLGPSDKIDVVQIPLNWDRLVLASGMEEARSAGVTPHAEHTCPCCGHVSNGSAPLDIKQSPAPGHLSLCAGCGLVHQFDEQLRLVVLEPKDLQALPVDMQQQVQKHQQRIRALRHGVN